LACVISQKTRAAYCYVSSIAGIVICIFIEIYIKAYPQHADIVKDMLDEKNKTFSLMVLNLSRDQLDRYGEIDTLVNEINKSLKFFKNYNLILNKDPFFKHFVANPILVKKHILNNNLQNILKIKQYSHLSFHLLFHNSVHNFH